MNSHTKRIAISIGRSLGQLCSFVGLAWMASAMAQEMTTQRITLTEPPVARVRADVAEHGITSPTPDAIKGFLKDQGAWYTPFSRPGMTGPYDIRSWHASPPKASTDANAKAGQP